jgi:hypothetical protein
MTDIEVEIPEMGDITHIERPSLPWRPERKTECGLDVTRHATWTRDEAVEIGKKLGRQRFSMHVCMTCMGTAERHATWEVDPASCLVRHASQMTLTRWGRSKSATDEQRHFADELRAIAALIEAHRDEFDALILSYGEVVDLTARRRERFR